MPGPDKITGVSGISQVEKTEDKMSGLLLKRSDSKSEVPTIREISGPTKVTKMTQKEIMEDLTKINSAVTVDPKSNWFIKGCESIGRWFQKVFPGVDITALDKAAGMKLESGSVFSGGTKVIRHANEDKPTTTGLAREEIITASRKGLERESVSNTFAVAESLKEDGKVLSEHLKAGTKPGKSTEFTVKSKMDVIIEIPEMRAKVIGKCEKEFNLSEVRTFEKIHDSFKESPPNLSLLVDTYDKYISPNHTETRINFFDKPDMGVHKAYNEFIADSSNPEKAKAFMNEMLRIAQHVESDLVRNILRPLIDKDPGLSEFCEKIK